MTRAARSTTLASSPTTSTGEMRRLSKSTRRALKSLHVTLFSPRP